MDDFASTALYNLIAVELRKLGMPVAPSTQFAGKTARVDKAELLNSALAQLGPSAIVAVGQGIRDMAADPTLTVLLRSDSPAELLERWQRLERYYHGRHRVRALETCETMMLLEHYSTGTGSPLLVEDLVVAGLFAALLQQIGCEQLSLSIGEDRVAVLKNDAIVPVDQSPEHSALWHFHWQSFQPIRTEPSRAHQSTTTTALVSDLIASDIGRNWRIGSIAELLNQSTRSLQRALASENNSFQTLLRTVRAESAAKLINERDCSLAEAGYACGFADQAHFSRDFKLRFNMSPSAFAELNTAS